MAAEPLTRETRYDGHYFIPGGEQWLPSGGVMYPQIEVTRCRSCGSMVADGDRDLHERLHPRVSCHQMGCGVAHFTIGPGGREIHGHAWEAQFRPAEPLVNECRGPGS
jgi:hypothetical protein